MDIVITNKKSAKTKRYLIIAAIAIPVILAVRYLWFLSQAEFSVDREVLVISEVKHGDFSVSVRGTGVLVPDKIQFLSANVDATVTKVAVKAGNVVKEGDIIVELSNPKLVQQLAEAKWDYDAMEAQLSSDRVAQESGLQQQKSSVLNAKLDFEKAVNEFEARSELLQTKAVSMLDFKRTQVELTQAKQRWEASKETLEKMQENLVAQNNARNAKLEKARNIYEHFQKQVDDLQVKASMDSIVLDVPVEVGQRLLMGSSIAKLAEQDSLIAEIRVPEIQIQDVQIGQRVIIDTRNTTIEGKVSRVDPSVINGNVQVDVVFTEELPKEARPDLSVDGEIKITDIPDTLFVARPLFAQSKGNSMFFKVTSDGDFAMRVPVEVGYGAINQIQVLSGLSVGDKIITSDPTRFESYEKIRIQ